jgi:hypothetical protein
MYAEHITTRAAQAPAPWELDGSPDDWAVFPRRRTTARGAS